MKLLSATIITGQGADMCSIKTDLPNPIWPFDQHLLIRFEAAAGKGEEYVKKTFDIDGEISVIRVK